MKVSGDVGSLFFESFDSISGWLFISSTSLTTVSVDTWIVFLTYLILEGLTTFIGELSFSPDLIETRELELKS